MFVEFEKDEKPRVKDQLLDHDADGIREYDNDLPRWWLYGFYFTIVCAVFYLYYYHAYVGPEWNFLWYKTKAGAEAEYKKELADARIRYGKGEIEVEEEYTLRTDAQSLKRGEMIFNGPGNLCYTCHRQDLGGLVGPNLTDEYWIHGGGFKNVMNSVKTGFPDRGMLPYGNNSKLTQEDLVNLASYIISKQGSNPSGPKPMDPSREKKYVEGDEESHDHASHQ